jgi:hypothetical protein
MPATKVMRVPEHVPQEASTLAALQGRPPAELIGEAWAEYVENHKQTFARDLEEAARLIRDGSVEDVVKFASRSNAARGAAAAAALLPDES